MILDRLYVDHLRPFDTTTLSFSPQINLITGDNGAGKTSILEAAHLLVRGRSFRRGGLDALISYGSDQMQVQGRFVDDRSTTTRIALTKYRGEAVSLRQDKQAVTKVSDIATQIPIQTFTTELASLVLGGPDLRRRWLDQGLAHSHPDALSRMGHYRHVLRQRNAALRQKDRTALEVWDTELGISGNHLTNLRRQYFSELGEFIQATTELMCPDLPITSEFTPGFQDKDYTNYIDRQRSRDVKLGLTVGGPHRADIQIRLGIESTRNRPQPGASTQVSRGQAKALAVALIMGQIQYLRSRDRTTLLLVDDMGSEMDTHHTNLLLQLIEETNSQTIATMVRPEPLNKGWQSKMARIHLIDGHVGSIPS